MTFATTAPDGVRQCLKRSVFSRHPNMIVRGHCLSHKGDRGLFVRLTIVLANPRWNQGLFHAKYS